MSTRDVKDVGIRTRALSTLVLAPKRTLIVSKRSAHTLSLIVHRVVLRSKQADRAVLRHLVMYVKRATRGKEW